ncbi:MAG: hypothetical protein EOP09_15125 [Proteobacteria bacterium]|nr:MAG: hypothetical protein EOP09_15125 [Pseudomonadota bacterium]
MSNKTPVTSQQSNGVAPYVSPNFKGLARREYFAGQFMAAILTADKGHLLSYEKCAKNAVLAADILIAVLAATPSSE